MENDDRVIRDHSSRSIRQEMRQVFADWVSKLPFVKESGKRDEEASAPGEPHPEQSATLSSTTTALAGDFEERVGEFE
jgi:hypothetical protein